MRKRRGFTLIELLVVVAIIGILATVVVVNLSSAQSKARDSRRKSDLGQVQQAILLYSQDKNSYPANPSWTAPISENYTCFFQYSYNELLAAGFNSSHSPDDWTYKAAYHQNCLNELVPTYLVALPKDPQSNIDVIAPVTHTYWYYDYKDSPPNHPTAFYTKPGMDGIYLGVRLENSGQNPDLTGQFKVFTNASAYSCQPGDGKYYCVYSPPIK